MQAVFIGIAFVAAAMFVLLALQRRVRALRGLTFPLLIAAFALGLLVAYWLESVGIRPVSAGAWTLADTQRLLLVTTVFLAAVLLLRMAVWYAFDVHLRRGRKLGVPSLLPTVVRGAGYIVVALIVISQAFPDTELGPLLATSAVTSLVLGLALQPILTNFFAGVVISLERPFRLQDWIQVGDSEGQVTQITWRTTHIRTRENDTVIFPNASIAQERVVNFLYPHPLHLLRIEVGVHYKTPPYRAREALLQAAAGIEGILDRPSAEVFVAAFGDSSITYELRVWIADMSPARRIESDVRARVWEEFRRRGIVIPFPIRTLEVSRPPRHDTVPTATLMVVTGIDAGLALPLTEAAVTIGRGESCDLRLREATASKQHFSIVHTEDGWLLEDTGSTHGTLVNGARVTSHLLKDMDRIRIAETELVFEADGH
ncbi:MAG: mechanosensitive ion channel [Acidobacteriota bacterium]|jgi:small-conductance mechanosensitive channel